MHSEQHKNKFNPRKEVDEIELLIGSLRRVRLMSEVSEIYKKIENRVAAIHTRGYEEGHADALKKLKL